MNLNQNMVAMKALPVSPPCGLMRIKSAAAYLGCSVPTIYRAMAHRGLPAHRLGGYWGFYPSELDTWVKAQPSVNLPSAS